MNDSPQSAVVYARFSPRPERTSIRTGKTYKPSEADSVEKQIERCTKWCEAKGYTIVGSFGDKALSGANTDDRPGLAQALALVKKHRAILVVYTLDRLSRDLVDAGTILKDLIRRKLAVASVTENLDLTTPAGRLLANILAAMAQFHRESFAERTSRAMLDYQAKGFRMGSRCPSGWKENGTPGRMEPEPGEAAAIEHAAMLRQAKNGWRTIAKELNGAGFRYRGGAWQFTTIRRALRARGIR